MIDTIDSPYIHAAIAANFQALVLDNSNRGPVLVNFWSRKAGPCLRQYPVLDKLIHHYTGRILLVNVDTETEIILSKEYGITSVPTLKLFRNGQVVETWHGYQSEADLTKVLDNYVARDSDQVLVQAIQLYGEGKQVDAYEMIVNAIAGDPHNPRLPLAMCKLLKHEERYEEAAKLISALPAEIRNNADIVHFHDLLTFYLEIDPASDIAALEKHLDSSPDDIPAKQQLVARFVIQHQYEQALQQLVNIMDIDPGFADNYAQKATIRIFNLLGPEHELVTRFRPALRRYIH